MNTFTILVNDEKAHKLGRYTTLMMADKLIRSCKDTLTIEYLTTALSQLLLLVLPSFRNIFCSSDFLFYCYFFALPALPFQPLALLFCYCMRFLFCYKLEPIWNLEINLTHCIFSFYFEQFNKFTASNFYRWFMSSIC